MGSMIIYLIAGMFAVCIFLFAQSLIPTKSDISTRLEQLEGLKWDPTQGTRSAQLEKLFNENQRTKLQQQLLEAGWYTVTPGKLVTRSISGAALGLTIGLVILVLFKNAPTMYVLMATVLMLIIGAYMPFTQLKGAVKKRKMEIQRSLPDLLDMLATTVQAGLAFNAALGYAADGSKGAIGEELKAVLSEVRLGRSRAEALRSMAMRVRQPDFSATVTAIVQAERLGSNLSSVLEELAEETRNKRMMRAEEIAQMMPTKMVIPMALFMLPALFVMIFGGVVAEFMQPELNELALHHRGRARVRLRNVSRASTRRNDLR